MGQPSIAITIGRLNTLTITITKPTRHMLHITITIFVTDNPVHIAAVVNHSAVVQAGTVLTATMDTAAIRGQLQMTTILDWSSF